MEGFIRSEVMGFAERMESVLRANDHKGGWGGCSMQWLSSKLWEEFGELAPYVQQMIEGEEFDEYDLEAVIKECVDIANVAMMIADNANTKLNKLKALT